MIKEFFEDREIFLTGGSGVVGKALVEKLLRSCNVRKIYLLLRPKKGLTIEERLDKLKKDLIFRRLHSEKPHEFASKVVPIPGDVLLPMLGISWEDRKQMENVSLVFHSAATVRFDEPLDYAIKVNVGGTHEALKLAETLKNLTVFMHISTFFSNPYLDFIEPKIYQPPLDWRLCLKISETTTYMDETLLCAITQKLITGFPNTYSFAKCVAESLVNDYRHKLPVAIYRPSIVIFAFDEPEPGFPSSLTGAMGLFALYGAGLLKTIYMPKNQRLDLAPRDIAIKTLLYYSVKTPMIYAQNSQTDIPIFHLTSYTHSTITFPEYIAISDKTGIFIKYAFEKNFLLPGAFITDNDFLFHFIFFTKQILPALLVDMLLIVSGRKPQLMGVQRKLYHSLHLMRPFTVKNFRSSGTTYADEFVKLFKGTDFQMDAFELGNDYKNTVFLCENMAYKVREILLKEDPSTIPRARKIMKVKIYIYRAMQIYLAYKIYFGFINPMLSNWSLY